MKKSAKMFSSAADLDENVHEMFLVELYSRIKALPFKSTSGNKCISIDMQNCSNDFVLSTEEFLKDNVKHFKLHVKSEQYYVEIVSLKGIRGALL